MNLANVPVYCIVLPGNSDNRIKRLLKEYGFKNIKIIPGVLEKKPRIGVAKAHLAALTLALEETDGPFLILEEDVDILHSVQDLFVPEDADAIYLGVSRWGLRNGRGELNMICGEKANGGLYRMYNMLAAHAVLYLDRDYAKFLINYIPMFINMQTNQDKLRAETMKYWNIYALNNPMFYQRGRHEKNTKFKLSSQPMVSLGTYYL